MGNEIGPMLPETGEFKSSDLRSKHLLRIVLFLAILTNLITIGTEISLGVGGSFHTYIVFANQIFACLLYIYAFYQYLKGKVLAAKITLLIASQAQLLMLCFFVGVQAKVDLFLIFIFISTWLIFTRNEKPWNWLFRITAVIIYIAANALIDFYNIEPYLPQNESKDVFLFANTLTFFFILAIAMEMMSRLIRKQEIGLRKEKEKSDLLLQNILPSPVAERLKKGEQPIADNYEEATVIFADLAEFTSFSREVEAPKLVELLNQLFSKFDSIVSKFDGEKIKTIGDAYMLATGVPNQDQNHLNKGLEIAKEMVQVNRQWNKDNNINIPLRIGLHSGKVVAGVIGKNRFIFDLWGDTVNLAARLESSSESHKIHITAELAEKIKDNFPVEKREKPVFLKGIGKVETYFLSE